MKPIQPYLNVQSLTPSPKTASSKPAADAQTPTVTASTQVSLSQASQQIGRTDATDGVNMEKVAQLKQRIADGNYQISADVIAQKLQGEL